MLHPRVAAWAPGNRFGEHVAFDCRYVAQQISERELAFTIGPLELVRRNHARYPHGPLMNLVEIVEKNFRAADLHGSGLQFPDQQFIHDLGAGLALGSLHDLSYKKSQDGLLACPVLLDLLRIRCNEFFNDSLKRGSVG